MSGVFVISGESLIELAETPYDTERLLQELIAKHPGLLAGNQISPESPRRWLLIKREHPIPDDTGGGGRWSVDHLFLDQDAVPTLIEVKRSTDTRIRREVVGQMLDYAANAVAYWPAETIKSEFEARVGNDSVSMVQAVAGFEVDYDSFWATVKTNLQV